MRARNGLSEYRDMEWDGALLRWICRSSVHLLSLYWTGGGGDHSRPVEGRGKRESKRERKMIFLYGQLFSKIGWGGLWEGGGSGSE